MSGLNVIYPASPEVEIHKTPLQTIYNILVRKSLVAWSVFPQALQEDAHVGPASFGPRNKTYLP